MKSTFAGAVQKKKTISDATILSIPPEILQREILSMHELAGAGLILRATCTNLAVVIGRITPGDLLDFMEYLGANFHALQQCDADLQMLGLKVMTEYKISHGKSLRYSSARWRRFYLGAAAQQQEIAGTLRTLMSGVVLINYHLPSHHHVKASPLWVNDVHLKCILAIETDNNAKNREIRYVSLRHALLYSAAYWGNLNDVKMHFCETPIQIQRSSLTLAAKRGHLDVARWGLGQCGGTVEFIDSLLSNANVVTTGQFAKKWQHRQ